MIAIAAFALALAIVALASMGGELTNELLVRRLQGERDPRVIATAADVLQRRGMHLAAETLRARARNLASGASTATSAGDVGARLPSPLPGVQSREWTAFVRAMATQRPDFRSPEGRIGMFETDLRWLHVYGCVGSVRRLSSGRLDATWIAPATEAAFHANARLQYRVFVANVKALRTAVEQRHGDRGVRLGPRHATTSGLVAVAHRLGATEFADWLSSDTARSRRPDVWRLFETTNGLF